MSNRAACVRGSIEDVHVERHSAREDNAQLDRVPPAWRQVDGPTNRSTVHVQYVLVRVSYHLNTHCDMSTVTLTFAAIARVWCASKKAAKHTTHALEKMANSQRAHAPTMRHSEDLGAIRD